MHPQHTMFADPFIARFWSHVDKDGPIPARHPELGPCWLWTGVRDKDGYGLVQCDGRLRRAPKVAWELAHDTPFPAGLWALHHCDTPPCLNPTHIYPGDARANKRDQDAAGRIYRGPTRTPAQYRHGEQNRSAKLTNEQARALREAYAAGAGSQAELGRMYGITSAAVNFIVGGRGWRHLGEALPVRQLARVMQQRNTPRGEQVPRAKLTAEQVQEIRQLYTQADISLSALGRRFGVTLQTIHAVVTRHTWKHIP